MRNPIRLKNLNARFIPFYLLGLAVLFFYPIRPEAFAVGLPWIAAGAALRGWGAGHLVKNHALTMTGPYAHLRHPLYLGTILIATGFAVLISGWMTLVVLGCIWPWFAFHYFPRKDRSEGARLEAIYGDAFRRYREAVPALWPRLRAWRGEAGVAPAGGDRSWALGRYSENNELGTLLAVAAGVLAFWLRAQFERP